MLYGIGGVGKTALASELVRLVQDREPDRVLVVLRGLSVEQFFGGLTGALRRHLLLSDAEGPAVRAVELAGRMDLPWQDRFAVLRDHLLDEIPMLIVLDDFDDNLVPAGSGWALSDGVIAEMFAASGD